VRQNLVIDADDTLWENNIYFEQAFDEFISFLNHSHLTPVQIRVALDEIELANIQVNGYGATNFAENCFTCYQRLLERDLQPEDRDRIMTLASKIMEQPIQTLPKVEETLDYLSSRHDLLLFTKGHPEEQKLKIDRSALGIYFGHTAIVREKDPAAYLALMKEQGLEPSMTWMIGNSPKSDINPALKAGMNAVYVHHPQTWHLEHTDLVTGPGRLIKLKSFSELKRHF